MKTRFASSMIAIAIISLTPLAASCSGSNADRSGAAYGDAIGISCVNDTSADDSTATVSWASGANTAIKSMKFVFSTSESGAKTYTKTANTNTYSYSQKAYWVTTRVVVDFYTSADASGSSVQNVSGSC